MCEIENFKGMFVVVQTKSGKVNDPFYYCRRNIDPPQHTGSPSRNRNSEFLLPNRRQVCLSANKIIAIVFWDALCRIHIDYVQKGRTTNGEYYAM